MLGLPAEFTSDFLARLEQLRIKTRREYAGLGKGSHLSPRRGSSLEFADFRRYAPGDDFRYVDWSLYGRSDKLYIKLFKEEEEMGLSLRQTMTSGWIPRLRSSVTECCVGFVFCSPDTR